MDILSPLISRFNLSASVFYSGVLCQSTSFDPKPGLGYLHVLREGVVSVAAPDGTSQEIVEPSLLFYPRPCAHRFDFGIKSEAKLVCALIDFGVGEGNPVIAALPDALLIRLSDMPEVDPLLSLLFAEAFAESAGRQPAIDRLMEYFLILVFRHVIETKLVGESILAGLADPRLRKALSAIHERPEFEWTIEELAKESGMSRARFAAHFRETTGTTPLDYLTEWRIGLAQTMLKKGKPLKLIAPAVGYSSAIGLSRAFVRLMGMSPGEWLQRLRLLITFKESKRILQHFRCFAIFEESRN